MTDGQQQTSRRRVRILGVLFILLSNLLLLEVLGYVVSFYFPGIIGKATDHLDHLADFERYQQFIAVVHDPVTGWRSPHGQTAELVDCTGQPFPFNTDENGARKTPVAGDPRVVFVGDSYTLGQEVGDDAAYPARVAALLDVPVVNYGVDGFGPHQAKLMFDKKIGLHPEAEVAVLGIMYENVRRVRNSFRAALYVGRSSFQYKPWIDVVDGEVRTFPNPNAVPVESREALAERAISVFENDHYAPEPPGLLRSVALIKSLSRRQTWLRLREGLAPTYEQYFEDEEFAAIIDHAVADFMESARRAGLEPLVVFIPNNPNDLTSTREVAARFSAECEADCVLDAGQMSIDWERYNIVPRACHPSDYGQNAIAEFLVGPIRDRLSE